MKAPITTIALSALAASLITFGVTHHLHRRLPEPKVGDVFTAYYDYRDDAYWHTNDWWIDVKGEPIRPPAQSVAITKVVKIEDGEVYTAHASVDISALTNWTDGGGYGPIENYTASRYRNHHILNPRANKKE